MTWLALWNARDFSEDWTDQSIGHERLEKLWSLLEVGKWLAAEFGGRKLGLLGEWLLDWLFGGLLDTGGLDGGVLGYLLLDDGL